MMTVVRANAVTGGRAGTGRKYRLMGGSGWHGAIPPDGGAGWHGAIPPGGGAGWHGACPYSGKNKKSVHPCTLL